MVLCGRHLFRQGKITLNNKVSITITQFKDHLSAQLHGSTLNKIRNVEGAIERASNTLLQKISPIDTMRTVSLTQSIHDDVYNYSLPSDYKDIIDLIPQDDRTLLDNAVRILSRPFDLKKAFANKTLSIEGSEGSKVLRVNWRSRAPKTINIMNSLTANGTWSAVGTASGLAANSIYKVAGSASIEFDSAATGDGIKNTTMTVIDLTDESQVGTFYMWVFFGAVTSVTSISAKWGNDLTTKYWTSTAVTAQADGTAFRIGWNLVAFEWSTATQTGTVAPATIDSVQVTVATTGAIANIRVDNITCSIGRYFDIKYYSKYLIKSSAGTWLQRTTDDSDSIVLDADAINGLIYETLIELAQQVEGSDSTFDMDYAHKKLYGDKNSSITKERMGFYQWYDQRYPNQAKKATGSYFNLRRINKR